MKKKSKRIMMFACAIFLIATGFVGYKILNVEKNSNNISSDLKNNSNEDNKKLETDNDENKEITIKLSAIGDCTLGAHKNPPSKSFDKEYDEKGAEYFFSGVVDVLSKDDITIANLEGAITENKSYRDKTFVFKGRPEYTDILKKGSIEVVNLANNHSFDYEEKGYEDTKKHLEEAKIDYFGYDNKVIIEKKGIKIGFLGYEGWTVDKKADIEANIRKLKEEADLVVVSFHWGIERDEAPMDTQTQLARASVDAGADLILGHHPHVIQGIEEYKGKNIIYSLSNFCFGGNSNPADKDTMIYQQEFTFDGNKKLIKTLEKNVIPASISSSKNRNDYRPSILEGEDKERVAEKIEYRSSLIK